MSARSEKVRKALYAKMNVASVVGTGKASAIYDSVAPEGAVLPYIVFTRVAPGPVTFTVFGPLNIIEDDLWEIRCLADEDSSTTKEPQELCEDILLLAETALGNSLTLTGNTVEFMARINDTPPLQELVNDRFIFHRGFHLRIQTA